MMEIVCTTHHPDMVITQITHVCTKLNSLKKY